MKLMIGLMLALGFLAACSDTGPVFPTPEHLENWVKSGESLDPRSDRAPTISDPVIRFRLARGERRSTLRTGDGWGLDQTYLMGFDVRLDPRHRPGRAVTLSRVLRRGDPASTLVTIRLDPRHGLMAMNRACVPISELNQWHRVEIRIAFADNDSGFLEVFCDRRPVWAQSGFRTTLPPTCRRAEGCKTPVPRPVDFEWQIGLHSDRNARHDIVVEMQRIIHHRLFVIPNRVIRLQP